MRLDPNRAGGGSALLGFLLLLTGCSVERLPGSPAVEDHPKLLMAFLSERPPSTPFTDDIYFYDVSTDGPPYLPANLNTPSGEGPCALSGNGRRLAFFSSRLPTGSTSLMFLYDIATGQTTIPQKINQLFYVQNPTLSYDGRFLAAQYQVSGPFDLFIAIQDLVADSLLQVPNLNAVNATNFDPSLSRDGSLMAFASNRVGTLGAFDIFLYSVPGDSVIPVPGLNSSAQELSASISADGRYIAFQSGRLGGVGLIDVYLYDRQTQSLLPLPGANTNLSEIQPTISPDGRYLAFASESTGGRDVKLYDIRDRRLLPLEGINDPFFFDSFPSLADR